MLVTPGRDLARSGTPDEMLELPLGDAARRSGKAANLIVRCPFVPSSKMINRRALGLRLSHVTLSGESPTRLAHRTGSCKRKKTLPNSTKLQPKEKKIRPFATHTDYRDSQPLDSLLHTFTIKDTHQSQWNPAARPPSSSSR